MSRVGVRRVIGRIGVRLWGPFILGAIVSLLVVIAMVFLSFDAQRRQVADLQVEVAESVGAQLDQYARKFQADVTSLAEVLPLAGSDQEAQRSLLKAAVDQPEASIYKLSIVGLDGQEQVKAIQNRTRPRDLVNLLGDQAFEAARAGDTYVGPVYLSESGLPALNMGVPIIDSINRVAGVLRAEIDLSTMWSLVNTPLVGESGYVYVVDENANLLAYRDVPRLRDDPSVADLPQVAAALSATTHPRAAAEFSTGLVDVPVLAYYLPVDIAGKRWTIIVEQPQREAYAQAYAFALIGAGLAAATLTAIALMGLFIRYRIARPIEQLRAGAGALAAGDLNYRIHVDTGDELEFLAQEFNEMSASLQQSQTRLAAMARARERQAEDAQTRLREMTALIQSGRAITSLDLRDVLSRLSYEVVRAIEGDRCSIYVLDERQRRLVLRGEWDTLPNRSASFDASSHRSGATALSNGSITYEWGEGIVGWVARENKPVFLANAQADKRFLPKAENDYDIAALIGVPLQIDDVVVGVLQASTRPGTPAFDPGDQRLLVTFASQAAAAIKNSYLYETERRRAQEMAIVAEIVRTISSSLDLDATLNLILSSVRRLIAYDLAEITLWDPENEVLKTRGRGADAAYEEYSRTAGGAYRLNEGFTGWIASRRAPLLITDLHVSAIKPAIDVGQFPIRSHIGVPLISANQLIGTLELAAYEPHTFNESHLETLKTIAGQAAVAIQNAQLYLESRRRAEELSGMFRVASVAASALEPDEIMRQIMAEASKLMGAQLGIVLLFNPETGFVEPHRTALFGADYEQVSDFRLDSRKPTFHHTVYRSGRVFRSDDALTDRRILKDYKPFIERFQARRTVSAPLLVRDQPIGEVHIIRTIGPPFDVDDEQRLQTLATLLGGVVETTRLAAERARRLDEVTGLYEISQVISSLMDLQEVYARITRTIAERVGVEYAGILLYDPERDALVSQPPFYGAPEEVLQYYIIPVPPGSAAHKLWTERETWISNDVLNDPLTREAKLDQLAEAVGVRRTVFAAMTVGTRRIGVVQVSNKRNDQPFDDDDARLMSIYATQIAALVENARLYALTDERLKQRADELAALSAISQELNATLDLERILDLVLDEAVRASGAMCGSIVMVEPGTRNQILRAMRGYTAEEVERARMVQLGVGDGIVGLTLERGEPIRVDDVRGRADYVQFSPLTRSEMAVPIQYALEVVGAINLESPNVGHFTDEHLSFLQALSAQAAIAIGNAQRYEEQMRRGELLRRRAEQLANLFEIGQAFRSDRPLIEVLDDVVHAVQETAGFNIALLSLLVGEPPMLERVAGAGLPVSVFEELKQVRQPWDAVKNVMRDAFRISQSYYIPAEHHQVTRDLDTWPPYQPDLTPRASGRWHPEDVLFTPLRGSGDRILGILSVDEPFDGRVPDRAMIETLELFANQAAIAVENARLLEDLQQRIDTLTLFNQVSRSISARLDLEGLLTTIVDASIELIDCRYATVFLRDETSGRFIPRKARGYNLGRIAHLSWAEGEGLVGAVARDGRALIIPDIQADPRFASDLTDALIAATMLVPIAEGGQVIGVLKVDKLLPRSFGNTDLMMLSTLADQAAVAIKNTQLFAVTQRQLLEQTVLYEGTRELTLAHGEQEAIAAVAERMVNHLGATALCYYSYDEAANSARIDYEYWTPQATARERRTALGEITILDEKHSHFAHVIQTRQPVVMRRSDPDLTEEERFSMVDYDGQTIIAVPMAVRDRVLGYFEIWDSQRERDYSEADRRLLLALASQTAVSIENAQLLEQTIARTRELGILFEATASITSNLALDRVLDAVGQQLLRALDVQTITVTRWDRGRNQAIAIADRDVDDLNRSDPPGTTYRLHTYPGALLVLGDSQPHVLRARDEALQEGDRANLLRLDLKALLLLPLVAQERIIGMVELGERRRDRSFTADEIQLAQTLAGQAAIAITNAELFSETQRRVAELQSINAVGQAITATTSLSQLVDLIRREVGRVIDTASFYIALYDSTTHQINFPIFYDKGEPISPGPIPAGSGVTGHIFTGRRPLVLNTPEDLRALGIQAYGNTAQSFLGVPMMIGDRVTGVMAVQDYERTYAYDEGHVRILSTVASQAAVAIENARLFEETQRRLREQTLLYDAGRAISASLEHAAVLSTSAEQVLRVTDAQGAIIAEWETDPDRLVIVHSRYREMSGIGTPDASGRVYLLSEYPTIRRALFDRESLLLRGDDATLDPRERRALEQAGFHYALMMPMVARDEVIGSVWLVDARVDREFSEADQRVIATLVTQIAGAITNARLFDQVRRFTQDLEQRVRQRTDELAMANQQLTLERDRVETLYRITSELSASLDLDRVLNRALALVNEAVGTSRGSILLVDSQSDKLIHRAALGRVEPLPPGGLPTRFKRSQGLAGWVIQNRLPAIVPNIALDDRWLEESSTVERRYRSALVVPLVAGDDALGALMLLHADEDYFADAHLRLVEAAGTQVATAINNAALYSFIRESAERLGTMLRKEQESEAKARAILESVTDGVLVADATGRIILFNAAAERILGRPRDAVLDRPTSDFIGLYGVFGPQWEDQVRQWRADPASRRTVPSLSNRIQFEDERRFVKVSIGPVTGPGEEFLGTVSVFRDITAEVEADRAKSEFVSTVSHELRTPMTSIKGYADLMLLGAAGSLNENQERFLGIIKSNADRLSVLVDDLLDISRIETGRVVLDVKHVSMAYVVDQVLTTLRERIEQKQLTVKIDLPDDDPLNVIGDQARLIQIVTNLIGNAYQYTPPGGSILVRARPTQDEMLQVEVTDTGIGIAPEDVSKVFDRFFRADDPLVQEFPGTGLGLSIVQTLVEMHGGEIWLESVKGQGTTFSFTIPLAEADLPADGSISSLSRAIGPRAARSETPRILVVDDDPDIANLIARNLAHVGYKVDIVGTGRAAIEFVRQEHPDLVTLDLYLPDVPGLDVLEALKADPETSDVPVVVVSVMPDDRPSLEKGAIDYVSKPLDANALLNVVSRVLGQVGTILVIEDDLDTSSMLTEALQRAGFRVMVTSNGRRGLQLARSELPNLILLDIKLPRMDGYTILQNLKKLPSTARIPVIIMTGSVTLDEVRRREFAAMGAASFLAKPFAIDALIERIDQALATAHGPATDGSSGKQAV